VLKSGTNQFHGSAYGYVQDYRLNANSYSNKQNLTAGQPTPINPFSFAQFGGTVGGPILHNKLFFFGDYLGSRWHKGGTGTASVMTQAMRGGDFSALLTGFATPIQLYDPLNNFAPYANDQNVPINNPVAKFLVRQSHSLPAAQRHADRRSGGEQLPGPSRSYKANNQGDVKIEYDPRANDKITGFYSMSTPTTDRRRCWPSASPDQSVSHQDRGHQLGAHLLAVAGQLRARRLYAHGLERRIAPGFDRPVRNRGDAKVGITSTTRPMRLYLPEPQQRP
jgi:hypothetical protein